MSISKIDVDSLLYTLRRCYFVGVATFSPCPKCKRSSRGGDYCKQCLIDELRRRGVSGALLNRYCQFQNKRLNAEDRLFELTESIRESANGSTQSESD